MRISLSELKNNTSRYVEMADTQDILITKNGKPVAKLVSATFDQVVAMESLSGIISSEIDFETERTERTLK